MKRVLVTGGSRGIGAAAVKRFIAGGYEVVVVERHKPNVEIEFHEFDFSEYQKVPELAQKIGPVDILVNNAGMMNSLPYDTYPDEKMLQLLAVNIQSPVALIREFSKGMIEKKSGRIVNLASVAGEIGSPDIWYGISKAGMINITKSFAKLLGPKGVVINAVAPGPVNTDMLHTIPEERKQQVVAASYLKRVAEPEEIAEAIYWLATDAPEYINGTTIDLNNGSFPR
jgi:NAD(P)-dependent dehydrogenase (short-subunit alcohol dehydrogenase family)